MKELLPCTLLEVPDGLFCNAVLEMGIDSTEGETLPFCTAAVLEGVVCKSSIVAVVVEDTGTMLLSKVLKGSFCFNPLFKGEPGHQVDILQSRVVVYEDWWPLYSVSWCAFLSAVQ
jgi:hypothetical protein